MWRNWVGNQSCEPARTASPESEDEVCELVAAAALDGIGVRVAAAGHSFTPVVVTDGLLLDLTEASADPLARPRREARRRRAGDHDRRVRRAALGGGARAREPGRHRCAADRRGDLDRDARLGARVRQLLVLGAPAADRDGVRRCRRGERRGSARRRAGRRRFARRDIN